jgi:hypothetical protein
MMLQTYRAILRGDRIDWIDTPPDLQGDTEVQITFVQPESAEERRARGQKAAAALERIARAGGIRSIPDPSAWQREIRQDRPLPGRDD